MRPLLFDFGQLRISSFAVASLLGMAVGWLVVRRLGPRAAPRVAWLDLYLGLIFFGLLGSKLLYALLGFPELVAGRLSIIDVLRSGGVWLGGVLGGFCFAWIFFRLNAVRVGVALNVLFTALPLAHAVGRIGCLMAGCCYGKACSLPWALTYSDPLAARLVGVPLGVPLHPTPLYEAALQLVNFGVCYRLWKRGVPEPWTIPAVWCGLYGVERFLLELLRGDPRGYWLGLSTSQWLSLAMVGAAAVWLVARRRVSRAPRESTETKKALDPLVTGVYRDLKE